MLDINSILNGKSKKKSKNNKNSFLSVFQKQKPGKMNMDFSGLKSMTNNNDFKPASKHKQKEWEMFTPRKKSKLLRKFKDTDKDKKPDKWDCQPFNILAQDTLYSVRSFGELNPKKKIHASDKYSRMSGRSTGWFGTGMYGYNDEKVAKADAKRNKGFVRKVEIKNPLRLSGFESHYLHDNVSKNLYKANTDREKQESADRLTTSLNNGYRLVKEDQNKDLTFGMSRDFTKQDVTNIQKEAKERNVNPINIAAKMAGYDGIVTGEEQQNRTYGSIKFYEDEIPYEKQNLSVEEKKLKRKWNQENQTNKLRWNREDRADEQDQYGKILKDPTPVAGTIDSDKDGNDTYVEFSEKEKIEQAERYYGKDKIEQAKAFQKSMEIFGQEPKQDTPEEED